MKNKEMYAALGLMRHQLDQQTCGYAYKTSRSLRSLLSYRPTFALIDHGLWIGLGRKTVKTNKSKPDFYKLRAALYPGVEAENFRCRMVRYWNSKGHPDNPLVSNFSVVRRGLALGLAKEKS